MFSGHVVQKHEEDQERRAKKSYLNQLSTTAPAQPTPSEPYGFLPMSRGSYVSAATPSAVHRLIRSPRD